MSAVFTGPVTLLGIPAPQLTPASVVRTAETTATEGSLELATSPAATNMRGGASLISTGTPSSNTLALTVTTQQHGDVDTWASYTYSDGTRTWDQTPEWLLTRVESVEPVLAGNGYLVPRAVTLPNGDVVCVYWDDVSNQAQWRVWDYDTLTWGASGAANVATSIAGYPEVWTVPGDTATGVVVWIGALARVDSGANFAKLRTRYSTDGGATWTGWLDSNTQLPFTGGTNFYRIRVRFDPISRTLLMVAQDTLTPWDCYTLRSVDQGATWQTLTSAQLASVRTCDLWQWGQDWYLARVADGSTEIVVSRMNAGMVAWDDIETIGAGADPDFEICGCVEPTGRFVLATRNTTNNSRIELRASTDQGRTWGQLSGEFPPTSDDDTGIIDDTAAGALVSGLKQSGLVYCGGVLRLFGTLLSSGDTVDNSIVEAWFGDRSNLPIEPSTVGPMASDWYPSDIFATKSATDWTFTGISAQSLILTATSGRLAERIGNALATGYGSVTGAGGTANAVLAGFSTDSSYAGGMLGILRLRAGDGVNFVSAEFRVDFSTNLARVYDNNAAAYLGAADVAIPSTDFEVYFELEGAASVRKACAYVRALNSRVWTTVLAATACTSAVGAQDDVRVGKLQAVAAIVEVLYAFPRYAAGYAAGTNTAIGIPAASTPDLVPAGVNLHWRSSPLLPGSSYAVSARSTTPLDRLSPWVQAPSYALPYRGTTGTAGATYRIAYDFGASYSAFLGPLAYLSGCGTHGWASAKLRRWNGAAWADLFSGSLRIEGFTDGATGFSRDGAASCRFAPFSVANTGAKWWAPDELAGCWVYISDGTDGIGARILRNTAGRFTQSSTELMASFEIDPSTISVVAGAFATLDTSTATGTIHIYGDRWALWAGITQESTRYYAVEFTLAEGYTDPEGAQVSFGLAYAIAHPYRDGASMRWVAPSELTVIGGQGIVTGRSVRERDQRIVELAWEQVLVPTGSLHTSTATSVPTQGWASATPRTGAETTLIDLRTLVARHGQRAPVVLMLDSEATTEPGSTTRIMTGDSVVHGYLNGSIDITATRGYLRPSTCAHTLHGGALTITEIV